MTKSDTEPPTPVAVNPKPNLRNDPTMFTIFHNVQFNVVQHKKYVKEMTKLYKKLDEATFRESFKNALLYLFKFGDTSANVDRVIQFVATFCTSLDDEEEFLEFVFGVTFDSQCVISQAVRYRASQLLAAILAALGANASLDDALCDRLLASQKQRLHDARGAVRCRAALALQRLQDPMDPHDEVTKAYRFHMSCDPSSSVRRAVVMSIAKSTGNVPFVLERLCDVDEAVRRAAFLYIAAINVTQLRVRQRVHTLKVGLTERSPRVRRVVEEILIPGWLACFQGNIITLLTAIRLDNRTDAKDSQYVAGKLLESLFKRLPVSELLEWLPTEKTLRLIPADKLNKESAWYWRHLAEHLQRIDEDETLEAILPDLVVFTGYIRAIVESQCPSETDDPVGFSTRQYVLQELGSMLAVYDVCDPTSRDALHKLLVDVLTGDHGPLSPEVIRVFVRALELVVPELSPRLEVVSGIITSLREPEEIEELPPPMAAADLAKIKHKRGKLRISLNVAMEAQEDAVREQNYALAAECKAKVEELQKMLDDVNAKLEPQLPPPVVKERLSDSATLNKCLIILNCALDTPQLTALTPMLQMIFSELETEIFKNPDLLETAMETVAIYGQLDKELAKQTKSFFFANLCDTTNESTVSVVLRCIIDLLCVHGATVFEHDVDSEARDNTTADDNSLSCSNLSLSQNKNFVLELLLKIMDSESPVYRQIIVEGLCRLLYLGHIESPAVLSRLLLLWFNPSTVEEDMLRQIIGVFFQAFPAAVDGAQEQIQKATIPTLRALANAPSSSPLAEIDQEAVVKFIVTLTRVNHELCDSQGGMAMVLVQHLSRAPAAPHAGLVCRTLALLGPPRDHALAAALAHQLRALCQKLPDKQSCRNLARYLGALEAIERASLNKMSHTGVTEGTIQEDSLAPLGRTTGSLPQPIGRSTHVVINETIEEHIDIDDTSPPQGISTITEEHPEAHSSPTPRCPDTEPTQEVSRKSSESSKSGTSRNSSESSKSGSRKSSDALSDSSDVSPVKKCKITKGKKKKLSLNRQTSEPNPSKSKQKAVEKTKSLEASERESGEDRREEGGVKRTRSQRSLVDVDKAQKAKAETAKKASTKDISPDTSPDDFANVTVRRNTAGPSGSSSDERTTRNKGTTLAKGTTQKKKEPKKTVKKPSKSAKTVKGGRLSRESAGSADSYKPFESDDDTLHTIVYDKEFVPSVLNDSSELVEANKSTSRGNITIPETPDASEESDVET